MVYIILSVAKLYPQIYLTCFCCSTGRYKGPNATKENDSEVCYHNYKFLTFLFLFLVFDFF